MFCIALDSKTPNLGYVDIIPPLRSDVADVNMFRRYVEKKTFLLIEKKFQYVFFFSFQFVEANICCEENFQYLLSRADFVGTFLIPIFHGWSTHTKNIHNGWVGRWSTTVFRKVNRT